MIARLLRNWLHRRQLENDLRRELAYHLERHSSELQERSSLSPDEAKQQAKRALGGMVQIEEEVRDVWLTRFGRDFLYDLRFSLRSFCRTPLFTSTVVLSFTLGIGATTAIYSVVNQIVLHALPVERPERLVLMDWQGDKVTTGFGTWNLLSYPICRDLDGQRQWFTGVFCRALIPIDLAWSGSDPKSAESEVVSGNYFEVLGVTPAVGRLLRPDDDRAPNQNPVVVLSYRFWKEQLGGASDVVGRKVLVNQHPMTVVGVAAQPFSGVDVGAVPALWVPAAMSSQVLPGFEKYRDRRTVWMQVLGRLRPGVTLRRVQVGLDPWFKAMLQEDTRRSEFPIISPERRRAYFRSRLVLIRAPQGHSALRHQFVTPLWMLLGVSVVLLGLACLNVAGLFLARGSAREREINTRLALGASRGRLGRQLLVDSLVLSLWGGLLGIATTPLLVQALLAFLPSSSIPTALHSHLDGSVLLFATAISIAAGVFSGLFPSWQAGRRSIAIALRERAGSSSGNVRLRRLLVVLQISLALILVMSAALFGRTLNALLTKGPGFVTSNLLTFTINPLNSGHNSLAGNRLMRKLREAIHDLPITQESTLTSIPLLIGGTWNDRLTIAGRERIATDNEVDLNSVTPGFFETMGISVLVGRSFKESDARPLGVAGIRSAIVNEAFARRYLSGQNPLEVRLSQSSGPAARPEISIIGVVRDASYRDMRDDSPQVYFSFLEGDNPGGTFYVKVRGTTAAAFRTLRQTVRSVDPTLSFTDFRTMDEQVSQSLNIEQLLATLSSGFGALALLLSLVGLYGVMAFVVTQRTREIGIRVALGAKRWSTIWIVMGDAIGMTLWGVGLGLPFVWALGRFIESQLFHVKVFDPMALLGTLVTLALVALGAALLPARRAVGIDPVEALRVE